MPDEQPIEQPTNEQPVPISQIHLDFIAKPLEEQNGELILEDGSKQTYKDGVLDGVSVLKDGTQVIFTNGILHSADNVATIIFANGDMHYYTNNVLVKVMLSDGTTLIGDQIP
jgi:hypothetical protein